MFRELEDSVIGYIGVGTPVGIFKYCRSVSSEDTWERWIY